MSKATLTRVQLIQLLTEEKKLVYQEKLQVLRVTKGVLATLLPFLTLLVAIAEREQAHLLYLLVPFATSSIALFLLGNLHTQNVLFEYLKRLDERIIAEARQPLPLYQLAVAQMVRDAGPYLSRKTKIPNPYATLGIMVLIIGVAICVWSIYQGNNYIIYEVRMYYWNYVFNTSASIAIVYTIYSFLQYGSSYASLRVGFLDEAMPGGPPKSNDA
jgi:hypothetical protein